MEKGGRKEKRKNKKTEKNIHSVYIWIEGKKDGAGD